MGGGGLALSTPLDQDVEVPVVPVLNQVKFMKTGKIQFG